MRYVALLAVLKIGAAYVPVRRRLSGRAYRLHFGGRRRQGDRFGIAVSAEARRLRRQADIYRRVREIAINEKSAARLSDTRGSARRAISSSTSSIRPAPRASQREWRSSTPASATSSRSRGRSMESAPEGSLLSRDDPGLRFPRRGSLGSPDRRRHAGGRESREPTSSAMICTSFCMKQRVTVLPLRSDLVGDDRAGSAGRADCASFRRGGSSQSGGPLASTGSQHLECLWADRVLGEFDPEETGSGQVR